MFQENETKMQESREPDPAHELIIKQRFRRRISDYVVLEYLPSFDLRIVYIFLHCSCTSVDVPHPKRRTHTTGD